MLAVTPRGIDVLVPESVVSGVSSVGSFLGAAGLRYTRYTREKAIENIDKFREAIRAGNVTA